MRWERRESGTVDGHQARGWRRREGRLELRYVTCPNCQHHKMFYHTSPNSYMKRHCTFCGYMESK